EDVVVLGEGAVEREMSGGETERGEQNLGCLRRRSDALFDRGERNQLVADRLERGAGVGLVELVANALDHAELSRARGGTTWETRRGGSAREPGGGVAVVGEVAALAGEIERTFQDLEDVVAPFAEH